MKETLEMMQKNYAQHHSWAEKGIPVSKKVFDYLFNQGGLVSAREAGPDNCNIHRLAHEGFLYKICIEDDFENLGVLA